MTDRLRPGDKAPDFTLPDQNGGEFNLAESLQRGKSMHLIYFYPKADTPGCTAQACALRDALPSVGTTAVIGISPDPPKRQAAFDTKYSLGFPLLSDTDHAVADAYGVWVQKSMYSFSLWASKRTEPRCRMPC